MAVAEVPKIAIAAAMTRDSGREDGGRDMSAAVTPAEGGLVKERRPFERLTHVKPCPQ